VRDALSDQLRRQCVRARSGPGDAALCPIRHRERLACASKRERIGFTGKHDLASEEKSSRNRLADFYAVVAMRQQDRSRVDAKVDCLNFLLREWGAAYEEIPDWMLSIWGDARGTCRVRRFAGDDTSESGCDRDV
jgi:hypothetical protein